MERSVPPPGCFQHKQPILEAHNSIARVPKNLTAYETQMSFTCQGPYLPALCLEDMWESEVNISGCSSGSFHFLFNIASHWPRVSSGRGPHFSGVNHTTAKITRAHYSIHLFFFFYKSSGDWTLVFVLVKKTLYWLSRIPSLPWSPTWVEALLCWSPVSFPFWIKMSQILLPYQHSVS